MESAKLVIYGKMEVQRRHPGQTQIFRSRHKRTIRIGAELPKTHDMTQGPNLRRHINKKNDDRTKTS